MNELPSVLDICLAFVKKNFLILTLLILAILFAPLILQIIAIIFLVGMLTMLAIPIFIAIKVRKMARQMEEHFRQAGGGFSTNFNQQRESHSDDGRVKVHVGSAQQKRVNDDVGDYVEFEEIKSDKK